MLRFLILVAVIATSLLAGCNSDKGTTSQMQSGSQIQSPDTQSSEQSVIDAQTAAGSYEEICYANNFDGERFRVVGYQEPFISANRTITNCRLYNDRLKGEVRRGHVGGLREFVGDVRAIRGDRIRIFTGSLPKYCLPKKGEILKVIWKPRRRR